MNTKKVLALTQEYRRLREKQDMILGQIQDAIHEKETMPKPTTKTKKLKGLKLKNTPTGRSTKQRTTRATRNTNSTVDPVTGNPIG